MAGVLVFLPFLIIFLFKVPRAYSQSKLPTITSITDAMNLNSKKITNLKMRSLTVNVTEPDFIPTLLSNKAVNQPLTVHGKFVEINRQLILLDGDNKFIDENPIVVGDKVILKTRDKYWYNADKDQTTHLIETIQSLDSKGEVKPTPPNGVDPVAYEGPDSNLPIGPVEDLQIYVKGLTRLVTFPENAKVVGFQNYHGLKCIRIEWGEKDKSSNWGYDLVCPDRDWKNIYSEGYIDEGLPQYKRFYQKTAVEQLQKVEGNWIPFSVYQETQKIGYKGEINTSRRQVKILNFDLDAVNGNVLFAPLLSPGTVLIGADTSSPSSSASAIGGSINHLLDQSQSGDFSFMDENIGDLGQP